MVHLEKQLLLPKDVALFAQLHDLLLVDLFDGNGPICFFLGRQDDFPVGSLAQDLAQRVLVERGGASGGCRIYGIGARHRCSCLYHWFSWLMMTRLCDGC